MSQNTIGRRVRALREGRDMSREDLAAALGLSTETVKKLEQGDRQADPRISLLKAIGEVFHVEITSLLEDDDAPATDAEADAAEVALLRAVLLAPTPAATRHADPATIWRAAEHGFAGFQAGHYNRLLRQLPDLIKTARAMPDEPASARGAYRAHHLAATTLMKYGGGPAAWHAAEKAVSYAKTSRDPIAIALAAQTLVYTMTTIGAAEPGLETALTYTRQLEDDLTSRSAPASTALGMLWLKGAIAAAESGAFREAQDMLKRARRCGENVPPGANLFSTGFDQVNVLLYQISIDKSLSRYGPAADGADSLRPAALAALPRERRTHHLIEAADTYSRLRRTDDALAALLHAEHDNPREIRTRPAARQTIKTLLRAPGPIPDRLLALAIRADVKA
ncbi:MAG TPA: helix-turn-helix transcriptional regulator [Actinospica sp.]|nr:helix-turn-helix transcriptional regulator [Actinospica sp.]